MNKNQMNDIKRKQIKTYEREKYIAIKKDEWRKKNVREKADE